MERNEEWSPYISSQIMGSKREMLAVIGEGGVRKEETKDNLETAS